MIAGYSSRCKACNSPHRVQIESWKVEDKLHTSEISMKLKEMGDPISRRALDNHFEDHYNVSGVAAEQYQQSQANLQEVAGERVSEIQIMDKVVAGKARLHKRLEDILASLLESVIVNDPELPKLPVAYVTLYNGCAVGISQAMKTKQELLGEDSGSKKAGAMQSWVDLMLEDEAK
jgi:hypothetical protein